MRDICAYPQNAVTILVGTKYDQFSQFPQSEQEEITRQVCICVVEGIICDSTFQRERVYVSPPGTKVCKGYEIPPDFFLIFACYQRSKDFQDCAVQGV